jgi:hypothetical protein
VLRAVGVVLAVTLLCGCGKSARSPVQTSRADEVIVAMPSKASSRHRIRLGSNTDPLFAAVCTPGAAVCQLTYGEGSHFKCVGHPYVVIDEEGAYVEHSTCTLMPSAIQASAARRRAAQRCSGQMMRMYPGPLKESEKTQEGSNSFILTNTSHRPCVIYGYPRVTLYHDGLRLPFAFAAGDGFYVTAHRPHPLLLAPGAQAFFELAKMSCDELGRSSTRVAVSFSGGGFATMEMSPEDRLDYCPGTRTGAGPQARVGDRLSVSPIVATPDER